MTETGRFAITPRRHPLQATHRVRSAFDDFDGAPQTSMGNQLR
jgi:hypothetical protein